MHIKTIANEIGSKKYFIAGNGALIYDIQKDEVIYEKYMNKQKILEITLKFFFVFLQFFNLFLDLLTVFDRCIINEFELWSMANFDSLTE